MPCLVSIYYLDSEQFLYLPRLEPHPLKKIQDLLEDRCQKVDGSMINIDHFESLPNGIIVLCLRIESKRQKASKAIRQIGVIITGLISSTVNFCIGEISPIGTHDIDIASTPIFLDKLSNSFGLAGLATPFPVALCLGMAYAFDQTLCWILSRVSLENTEGSYNGQCAFRDDMLSLRHSIGNQPSFQPL
jgi:hypothetical protein